ncbi:hypothetical protein JKP88DRAFT_230436, partial [Tribonema minus]
MSRRGGGSNNLFLRAGLPFIVFVAGGSLFLSYVVTGHVETRDRKRQSQSLRQFDLQEEHRKLQQQFASGEDFKIVRIPRPGEKGDAT